MRRLLPKLGRVPSDELPRSVLLTITTCVFLLLLIANCAGQVLVTIATCVFTIATCAVDFFVFNDHSLHAGGLFYFKKDHKETAEATALAAAVATTIPALPSATTGCGAVQLPPQPAPAAAAPPPNLRNRPQMCSGRGEGKTADGEEATWRRVWRQSAPRTSRTQRDPPDDA